jgi:anti-anti-sigma factor
MVQVVETQDGVLVCGFLDVRAAAEVRAALQRALDRDCGDVHLDVTGVDAMDVTGLAVIVAAHRRAVAGGRRLVLTGVRPALARVLAVTRLHRVLAVSRAA